MITDIEGAPPSRRLSLLRPVGRLGWVSVCVCVLVWAPLAVPDEPDGEAVDPTWILAKYRAAVRDLQATYVNAQIVGTSRIVQTRAPQEKRGALESGAKAVTNPTPGGGTRERSFAYAFCDGKERIVAKGVLEGVVVDNGSAQFSINRPGPGKPYSVKFHSTERIEMNGLVEMRQQLRDAPYRPGGLVDVEKYVNSPHFSIEWARRRRREGGSVISLLVHHRPPTEQEWHFDGRMDLDESLGLVIRQYELEFRVASPKRRVHMGTEGSVEYKREGGKVVPTHVVYKTHPIPEKQSTRWEYDISSYSLVATPPEEFTLAYYGLGDFERTLGQVETRSSYRTAWAAAIAFLIGFILFGVGVKVQKARARALTSIQPEQIPDSPPR
jgi:hypothetical protein